MYCILYVPYLLYTSYYLTLPLTPESKSASISGNNFMVLSMEVSKGSNLFRDPRNWRNSEEALVPHHFPQTNHWNIGMCKPNYAEKSLFQTHFNTHTQKYHISLRDSANRRQHLSKPKVPDMFRTMCSLTFRKQVTTTWKWRCDQGKGSCALCGCLIADGL